MACKDFGLSILLSFVSVFFLGGGAVGEGLSFNCKDDFVLLLDQSFQGTFICCVEKFKLFFPQAGL